MIPVLAVAGVVLVVVLMAARAGGVGVDTADVPLPIDATAEERAQSRGQIGGLQTGKARIDKAYADLAQVKAAGGVLVTADGVYAQTGDAVVLRDPTAWERITGSVAKKVVSSGVTFYRGATGWAGPKYPDPAYALALASGIQSAMGHPIGGGWGYSPIGQNHGMGPPITGTDVQQAGAGTVRVNGGSYATRDTDPSAGTGGLHAPVRRL